MRTTTSILEQPLSEAVARVVSRNLRAAKRALARDDAEALHAFRVALRRTRTTLRAYRRWLSEVRRKDRRRLRRLARATNPGRDAEVLLPLLTRFVRDLAPQERPHVAALRRRLGGAARGAASDADALLGALRRAARPLRRRLGVGPASTVAFAAALGLLLEAETGALDRDFERLRNDDAPEALHVARLSVKRVRYLLEPIRRDVRGTGALVRELQGLQATLGDLHDLDVLAELVRAAAGGSGDAPAGLLAVGRAIAARRAELLRALRDDWLCGRAPVVTNALRGLARRLLERSTPTRPTGDG